MNSRAFLPRTWKAVYLALSVSTGACAGGGLLIPPTPALPNASWERHVLPDGSLQFLAPAEFGARNQFGCYEGRPDDYDYDHLYSPGWRDFCLTLISADRETPRMRADSTCLLDCAIYEDVSDHVIEVGALLLAVQTALVSGTINGKVRSPEMLVRIPLSTGGFALMRAEYGDLDDAAVLLGIAGTISGT